MAASRRKAGNTSTTRQKKRTPSARSQAAPSINSQPVEHTAPFLPEQGPWSPANQSDAVDASRAASFPKLSRGLRSWKIRPSTWVAGVLFVALVAISAILLQLYYSGTQQYDEFRYARSNDGPGAFVRSRPGIDGDRVRVLKPGSIFKVLGETRWQETIGTVGSGPWYQVELMSGKPGWVFSSQFEVIYKDIAEKQLHRQRAAFEDRLKREVVNESARRIYDSGQFRNFRISDIRIVSPLMPASDSPSFNVQVNAWMVGTLVGVDKIEVATRVNLDMELNHGLLTSSGVRVRHVDIQGYEPKEGISTEQAVNLLMHVL